MARQRDQAARRNALIEATYAAGLERGLRSLSLTDVAKQAGLTRGAVLYYYEDLDSLLVEAHAAGVTRFCDERDARVAAESDPRAKLDVAFRSGLPSGPDDALMRLLLELDILAGSSDLHEELMQELNRRQVATYLSIVTTGIEDGAFTPALGSELVAQTFVALEDGYGIHIVADRVTTHEEALRAMTAVAAQLGCPTG
ncbi:TetR family transcriptional regulator [Rathayibacter tritici]|uniref:TetR family transcriptional regulator n=1 Tax=Rathayibacter tritici TaxID=33888 RepID=A0A160KUT6_9MICO|nr:TetR family transcriptional regulator [Rathayibacter tritici]AND17680.1 TetR family transcriptional regulator [Rathayibacter tritici]PPF67093.1 TetR family transcriptional regulator [Rathayibacter tritici]PPG06756.1 TetR family transcriptional regulator [Rathayibacter tritici]PPI49134.1 TetR family transcriptional regulator [Rathayibacter tritici]